MLKSDTAFSGLLKEGYRHNEGIYEVTLNNIEACRGISEITKTSYGPQGMQKLIINHIDKLFVSNDASTILREINVNHPAANLVNMAAQVQNQEHGDGTNFVVTLAGEILNQAEKNIWQGLHPGEIVKGLEIALQETKRLIQSQIALEIKDIKDEKTLKVIESSLASKQPIYYKFFSKLVFDACKLITRETSPRFDADNLRVCKILGGDIEDSQVVKGFVINRVLETQGIENIENAKVAVYKCPFQPDQSETKGTVLVENAQQLLDFSWSEEIFAENLVKQIKEKGVNLVVAGGSIADICMHYFNKYEIGVLRIPSKFELLRLAKLLNANPINSVKAPSYDEIGFADWVQVKEIGSTKVTIIEREQEETFICSLVLRGSSNAQMENVQRSLEAGVSVYKQILFDNKFVNGAGAIESFISSKISDLSLTLPGLEQYGVKCFSEAFETFGKILMENAGLKSNQLISELVLKNSEKAQFGVDVFGEKLTQSEELEIYDNLSSKMDGIELATTTACTILRIDQIILSKPAGGPKPKGQQGWDNDD